MKKDTNLNFDINLNERVSNWIYQQDTGKDRHIGKDKESAQLNKILIKLSSWIYYLSTKNKNLDNICIIDTVSIVNLSPTKILLSISKNSLTAEYLKCSNNFNLTAIGKNTNHTYIKRFGYHSGYDKDSAKINSVSKDIKRSKNGLIYIDNDTCYFLSCSITDFIELHDHYIVIAGITESKMLSDNEQMSYEYYYDKIRPILMKNYTHRYKCKICGYIHSLKNIPEQCPVCHNDTRNNFSLYGELDER